MIVVQIDCDSCGGDLGPTGTSINWHIVLSADGQRNKSEVVAFEYVLPPLDRAHHFCHLDCLRKWLRDGGL